MTKAYANKNKINIMYCKEVKFMPRFFNPYVYPNNNNVEQNNMKTKAFPKIFPDFRKIRKA